MTAKELKQDLFDKILAEIKKAVDKEKTEIEDARTAYESGKENGFTNGLFEALEIVKRTKDEE